MPVNRGQQHQPTRWYELCFVTISTDSSSDDSDTESVILEPPPPPPLPPPDSEFEADWLFLPPPPPPRRSRLPVLPSTSMLYASTSFGIESQHDLNQSTGLSGSASSSSEVEQLRPNPSIGGLYEVPNSIINSIHMVKISKFHEIDKQSQCPICMEDFEEGDQACRLPCNHAFRSECILRWLNIKKTCPVCRLHLEGWEGCSDSRGNVTFSDDDEGNISLLNIGPVILAPDHGAWEYFFQPSQGLVSDQNDVGDNSDEAEYEYDTACEELGDSHEDGTIIHA